MTNSKFSKGKLLTKGETFTYTLFRGRTASYVVFVETTSRGEWSICLDVGPLTLTEEDAIGGSEVWETWCQGRKTWYSSYSSPTFEEALSQCMSMCDID